MALTRKSRSSSAVSTASLPDIVFMLLIFFIVTAVIKEYNGLPVTKPKAEQIKKLINKKNTVYLWVTKDGEYSVDDDVFANIEELSDRMIQKTMNRQNITVNIESVSFRI